PSNPESKGANAAANSDYAATNGVGNPSSLVSQGLIDNLGGVVNDYNTKYHGVMRVWDDNRSPAEHFLCRSQDITDGLSQTMIITEGAGRPALYVLGVKQGTTTT